ncbi:MAG: 50S ribosomal protein L6 [archaeon]
MKNKIEEIIEIPEGVTCIHANGRFSCEKSGVKVEREMILPRVDTKIESGKITITAEKGNKIQLKLIKSYVAHIKNMFKGMGKKFEYHLEACNVHFPMTMKLDGNKLIINNFLGEKVPRFAVISPGVNVEIKGQKILVSSHNRELAGQTMANIEKATKVRNRDRRIFQDGIFLTERPGRDI